VRSSDGGWATLLAVSVAAAAGVVGSLTALIPAASAPHVAIDAVGHRDAMLSPARALVREGERGGCVATAATEGEAFARYAITQYALAPATLVRLRLEEVVGGQATALPRLDWLVLVDVDPTLAPEVARSADFPVARQVGSAVLLLRESR
jgi:hypothetical protein